MPALGVTPADVAETQAMVDAGELTDKLARVVFDGVIAGEGRPVEVVAGRGLKVVSDCSFCTPSSTKPWVSTTRKTFTAPPATPSPLSR